MSKHQLLISIGPSYDLTEHTTIVPNDDSQPCLVDSPNFTGRICVRILDYKGLTPPGTKRFESSPYFKERRERYSIQVQGRFKGNWTGDDIVFGNNFDRRINLPPGSWLGLKILQCIDAGLEADIYGDKPWALSPLIYTMNKLRNEEYDKDGGLPPWPSPRGEHIDENVNIDGVKFNDDSKRKKYFEKKENRKKIQIKDDQIWNFDFFNSYMDFNEVAVTLPGFKFPMLQYWDGQPIRYVCKTRDSSVIFFVILFQLIPIDQKEESLNSDISNLTPKSGARWASLKSPSSFLTKSKKGISLSPSPTPSTTSNSDDDADPKRSK